MTTAQAAAGAVRTAITIGNFDGVHAGHRALVAAARALAGVAGRVVALCFDPHPFSVLRPQLAPARLTTFPQREALLRQAGADAVVRLQPTTEFLALSPEQFIRSLIADYHPSAIVEGPDFHFGAGRKGSPATLAALGEGLGFSVQIVQPVEVVLDDQLTARASSTMVRWLLSVGRVADAARVLGRPHALSGMVRQGQRRGRTIGVPTANLEVEQMLPADGVYAAVATLPDGRRCAAAMNVGTPPTFGGAARTCEVHLLDVQRDAERIDSLPEYGWQLAVEPVAFLRDQVRFPSIEALQGQIARDIRRAREAVARFAPAPAAA